MRTSLLSAGAVLAVLAACTAIAFGSSLGKDYPGPTCIGCDYAGPSITALAHGDLHGFFANQPVMGSVSLLLRAPAAAVSNAFGGGLLAGYQAGVLACLVAFALLAMWFVARLVPPALGRLPTAQVATSGDPDLMNRFYLAWAIPAAGILGAVAFKLDSEAPVLRRLRPAGQRSTA